ncbi:unknown [Bacteroides uniformis CAG:3]|nr:unknown [Bacteroides uniformis CAG:3]
MRSLENKFKNTLHITIQYGFIQFSGFHPFDNHIILVSPSRLEHIITCYHLSHGILPSKPVSYHHTLEIPLITQ